MYCAWCYILLLLLLLVIIIISDYVITIDRSESGGVSPLTSTACTSRELKYLPRYTCNQEEEEEG